MTDVALFGVGLLVTLIVAAAVSLLIWGAVLDGREDDEHRAETGRPHAPGRSPEAVSVDVLTRGPILVRGVE